MIDLKKIQEITSLPDKILVNGKTAYLAFIQLPENIVSIGYYFSEDGKTMKTYTEKRVCEKEVDLFDLIIDFKDFMKGILE